MDTYQFLDSGNGRRLETFGDYRLIRPCPQALWPISLADKLWEEADAEFLRDQQMLWKSKKNLPKEWLVSYSDLLFKIKATDFGHLGLFSEHAHFWSWMKDLIKKRERPKVLNLFAYTGGASMAAAKAGAEVCHVDASKGVVSWAKENALLNQLDSNAIRWIVDDAMKFLKREIKRGNQYDAIVLDPPSFGRGRQGEVFKIEKDLSELLKMCHQLLSDKPLFVFLSCHTPLLSPSVLSHIVSAIFPKASLETGEIVLKGTRTLNLPSGSYARCTYE